MAKDSLEASREHTCATVLLSRGVHPRFVHRVIGALFIAFEAFYVLTLTTGLRIGELLGLKSSMGRATAEAIDAALG